MKGRAGRFRRILGDILIALFAALTADVAAVMLRRIGAVVLKNVYRSIFRYELILCAVLLVFALDVRFCLFTRWKRRGARAAGRFLRGAVAAAAAAILFFCGRVCVGCLLRTAAPADHAVVLGMALENGEPTRDLISRVETARAYWGEHPGAVLILTGGNPDDSGRTEAAVMRDLLLARGVPDGRMLLEDRAATTMENFRNTARMLPAGERVVLITSGCHMDRAVRTAKRAGFTGVLRLPAPSDPLSFGANMMWEVVMDVNELLR